MIQKAHPIRAIKGTLGIFFREMDEHFEEMYAESGRPSIPPERLLLSKLLMALYTIRSERQFCELLRCELLFRWFLDLNPDEVVIYHSTFSQMQAGLLQRRVADLLFAEVVWFVKAKRWISDQRFSVDGTLIESWVSLKSF
jgi:transposase